MPSLWRHCNLKARALLLSVSVVALAAASLASGQAPSLTRQALPRHALGCFVLLEDQRQSAWGRLRGASAIVRLDSVPLEISSHTSDAGSMLRRVEWRDSANHVIGATPRSPSTSLSPLALWSADSLADSIRIRFTDGFTGSVFVFALPSGSHSDTLFGRAYTFVDAGPPYQTDRGRAFAVRRSCE